MDEMVEFLRGSQAAELEHSGRTLMDHLIGTREVLRRWGAPVALQTAGLFHSVYGTDRYAGQAFPLERRDDVAAVAGVEAERLAHLFCTTPRQQIIAGTAPELSASDRAELQLLNLANEAEQLKAPDGSPGRWLSWASSAGVPGKPVALADAIDPAREEQGRQAYLWALREGGDPARLALAADLLPVAEPRVYLAVLAARRADRDSAAWWAGRARVRFAELGTTWDKRLSWEEWHEVLARVEAGSVCGGGWEPAALLDGPVSVPEPDLTRFHLYASMFADRAGDPMRRMYPGLSARPWHETATIPLAVFLEENADQIRDEVAALHPAAYHRESEKVPRSGDWDVVFFNERGRRRTENLDRCPTIAKALESLEAMKTIGGLAYLSRLKPGAHVKPHRGPTNLRLRVHLGLDVPAGDCGLRVGGETRQWTAGKTLAFDDSFEHEAWNRTGRDRTVLIVDIWHPDLTPAEVDLVAGLHRYAAAYASELGGYWSANARAAKPVDNPGG